MTDLPGSRVPLAPPALPSAKPESAEEVAVRLAGLHLESARREIAVKAETAARYHKAWKDSRARCGAAGDPALWRVVKTEVTLFRRAAEALVRPAVKLYAEAARRAIVAGKGSCESLVAKLLGAEAIGQSLGLREASLLSPGDWRRVLDAACIRAAGLLRAERTARSLGFAVYCHGLAEAFDGTDLPSAKALDALLTAAAEGQ